MNRRSILNISAAALLGLALLPGSAVAQQKTLKEQLIGTWTLVSADSAKKDDTKTPFAEGTNLKGLLIFTANRFSWQIISEFPKLASNDRLKTTPEENKAVAHSGLSYFGTYTVSETDKILTSQIERSSFPNQNGIAGKRTITSVTADELKFSNPASLAGNKNDFVWKRAN